MIEPPSPTSPTGGSLSGCPDEDLLDIVASGGGVGAVADAARAHAAACPRCRQRLAAVRDDAQIIAGYARAARAAARAGAVATSVNATAAPARPTSADLDVPADLVPGYRILAAVHAGGQGVVYRAEHLQTRRIVAIKTLLSGRFATPEQRRRFEREAEIAARLKHPNVVTIFDTLTVKGGRYAIVMEYIDGVVLDRWVAPGAEAMTPRQRLATDARLFIPICDGVQHAHNNGVVHRDLKPSNILVEAADAIGRPRIVDFGVAQFADSGEHAELTAAGEFAGSIQYASPEQMSRARFGAAPVDARSDVYTLGVMLYQRVCGRFPYNVSGSAIQVATTILEVAPDPPTRLNPAIDRDLATILLLALHKDPNRRYASAAALQRDLMRWLEGEAIEARSDSSLYVLRKAARRYRVQLAVVAGISASLVGLVFMRLRAVNSDLRATISNLRTSNLSWDADLVAATASLAEERAGDAEATIWGLLFDTFDKEIAIAKRPDLGARGITDRRLGDRRKALWALRHLYRQRPCYATTDISASERSFDVHAAINHPRQVLRVVGPGSFMTELSLPELEVTRFVELPAASSAAAAGAQVAAISADGQAFAKVHSHGFTVWNLDTLESTHIPDAFLHQRGCRLLRVGPRGETLAWIDDAGHSHVLNRTARTTSSRLPESPAMTTLAFLGNDLTGLSDSGNLLCFNSIDAQWQTVAVLQNADSHSGAGVQWAMSPAPDDRSIAVTDGRALFLVHASSLPPWTTRTLTPPQHDRILTVASTSGEVWFAGDLWSITSLPFDVTSAAPPGQLIGHGSPIQYLGVTTAGTDPDAGSQLVSIDRSGSIRLWTIDRGHLAMPARADRWIPASTSDAPAFDGTRISNADETRVAVVDARGNITVDATFPSGEKSHGVIAAFAPAPEEALHRDSPAIVTGQAGNRLNETSVARCCFTPDGSLLVATDRGWVDYYHLAPGEEPERQGGWPVDDSAINAVAASSDGEVIAAASGRAVVLLDARIRQTVLFRFSLPPGVRMANLSFSADSRWLSGRTHRGDAIAWDLRAFDDHIAAHFDRQLADYQQARANVQIDLEAARSWQAQLICSPANN